MTRKLMPFTLHGVAPGSRARRGTITTAHGVIETPIFMPVGTRATVRTQTLDQLAALGPPIILANTYHLLVRPGLEAMQHYGGVHRWMGWDRAILTDSGGFQIFSLPGSRTMGEVGAEFRSYADGSRLMLTPEHSIAMQLAIGSDIMMVLDQCIDSTSPHDAAREAMELTHRWAHRSLAARGDSANALFAIVQGACFEDLRRQSADTLTSIDGFDGFAIGGLAVGETRAEREDFTELCAGLLPTDRPRYLMGVGTPLDLLEGVHRGVDMFDCVLPTSFAQQGVAFTSRGKINLRRGIHKLSQIPLDPDCPCDACSRYTRSYLHHLMKCREPLGWQLLAFHNLRFYLGLMTEIRAALDAGTFAELYRTRRIELALIDQDTPPEEQPRRKPRKSTTLGAFEVKVAEAGHASIAHVNSGEVMHSVSAPDDEAERIYIAQSRILANAVAPQTESAPLVVWDVGLGAAHNAMALVRLLDANPGHPPVELHSFEHDLDALKLVLLNQKLFPHVRHEAPHKLVHAGTYAREGLRWHLHVGDFETPSSDVPAPDVVFFDPFSPKVDTSMWSLSAFRSLHARMTKPAELFTYSNSTAVRTSMLLAGFTVAAGVGTGPKRDTTIALAHPTDSLLRERALLDAAWLGRRTRSTAAFSADVPEGARPELEVQLQQHPQFR